MRRVADNVDAIRMYYRRTNFRLPLALILLPIILGGAGGVPLFGAPDESDDSQAAASVVPVEIRSVDLAQYPRVRVVFTSTSPYPRFVTQNEATGFRLSEAYGEGEWSVFAGDSGTGGVFASGSTDAPTMSGYRPPNFRTLRLAADRLNVVLIVDSTKSMPEKAFRSSIAAAREMVSQLGSQDRMALYTLAGEPNLVTGFTGDQSKLKEKLAGIQRKGKVTRVFDTLYSGLYTAQKALGSLDRSVAEFKRPPAGESRTIVLLLTDARDEDSFLTDEDCLELSELGRRMSIPIYVGLYGRAKHTRPRLLKRLTLITGGTLMANPRPEQAGDLLREFRRLPRAYYEISYHSPAAVHGSVFPGATIRQRIALLSNGSEYANVFDYQVPFWAWCKMHLFTTRGLLVLLLFLICVLVFIIFWILRRSQDRGLAPIREVRSHVAGYGGDQIPPLSTGAMPGSSAATAGRASHADESEQEDIPDIAPYLLAGHSETEPGTVLAHSEPAGVLMDDERTLYMREYTYRTTQMAVRQGIKYRRASLVLELRGGEASRDYDLFLDTTVIGSGRWANIPLRDETVSAVHAKVKRIDQRFIAYDLLSASGVYINGRKLLRPRALNDGDEVRIGRSRFSFRGVR